MPALKKASLVEITSALVAKPIGRPIEVQFNPTSLKLNITNEIEGASSRGRQARQYVGSSSSMLSMDLVFDTADEGSTEMPRSVAEKTKAVERFVLPKKDGDKQSVPKLRFQWGKLIFDGVVHGIDIDFEHFAADGTPLRAKVRLQIKEQDASYQLLQTGPGAARKGSAALPGAVSFGAGAQLGAGFSASASAGIGVGASFSGGISGSISGGLAASAGGQVGVALSGETAVEFAARVGVDPSAWRGLQTDLSAGLALEAGAEVGFDLGLSASAGLGVTVGVEASAEVSVEAAFGLAASGSAGGVTVTSQGEVERQAGFALAAAGGVTDALASVENHQAAAAVADARVAFAATASTASVPSRPSRSQQARPPLRDAGRVSVTRPAVPRSAPPAPAPPRADLRASSFGRGVPLRPVRPVRPVRLSGGE